MHELKAFLKGKKVTLLGLGLLGRGVGDAKFLAEAGAILTVTDLKTKEELKDSLKKLAKYNKPAKGRASIKYVLGEHRLEDFKNADLVIKSAGVPLDSIYIKEARKNKIPVEMSAALFAKYSDVLMVGVTGTRGKSTVTQMIAHILREDGKAVILGGNVRGVSNLELLKLTPPRSGGARKADIAVFELDSWQLQGFGDSRISPALSVFTTFYPDHMVYYGSTLLTTSGAMKKYFADKANIFKYQNEEDILIAGSQAAQFIKKWGGKIKSNIFVPGSLPKNWKLKVKGEHNLYNATLAAAAAEALGVKDKVIKKALENFPGVEGRLQFIREVKGVKYYNDTTATTPEATIAALKALGNSSAKSVILIMGGSDKNLDMSKLVKEIPKHTKHVVLLKGTGTDKISKKLKVQSYKADSLKEGIIKAKSLANKGDIVLLSPGFASFGMFKNEYDRGDQFNQIVKNLK